MMFIVVRNMILSSNREIHVLADSENIDRGVFFPLSPSKKKTDPFGFSLRRMLRLDYLLQCKAPSVHQSCKRPPRLQMVPSDCIHHQSMNNVWMVSFFFSAEIKVSPSSLMVFSHERGKRGLQLSYIRSIETREHLGDKTKKSFFFSYFGG